MVATRFRIPLALLLVLLAGACGGGAPAGTAAACEQRLFEGARFTACRYDSGRDRIALMLDDGQAPLRDFKRLGAHLGRSGDALRFAMNAGMYDEAGRPIGLYIERSKVRHPINLASGSGNFTMKPNGVFSVAADGQVAIDTSQAWTAHPRRAEWATQSGPMLVIGGRLHPHFQADGPSLNLRNGVGVSGPETAWFAISDDPVSFGRFARFFRDSLHCPDALFLDGAVSSLWDKGAGRRDRRAELGPMVLVFGDPG